MLSKTLEFSGTLAGNINQLYAGPIELKTKKPIRLMGVCMSGYITDDVSDLDYTNVRETGLILLAPPLVHGVLEDSMLTDGNSAALQQKDIMVNIYKKTDCNVVIYPGSVFQAEILVSFTAAAGANAKRYSYSLTLLYELIEGEAILPRSVRR